MSKLNNEIRELSIDELDIVSGGFVEAVAALILGFGIAYAVGGSTVDGFVSTATKAAQEKLNK